MSRPNKPREIFAEDNLAERVAAERDARSWTNDGLAKRMTDAGCPMTGSAIFKIEKASPRRRIVVDELVTFAKVFGVPMEDLLLPPAVSKSREFKQLLLDWHEADQAFSPALAAVNEANNRVLEYVEAHPDMAETLNELIASESGRPRFAKRNSKWWTARLANEPYEPPREVN